MHFNYRTIAKFVVKCDMAKKSDCLSKSFPYMYLILQVGDAYEHQLVKKFCCNSTM